MMTPPARLVLVDDHAIVRRGLRQLIEREPDLTVVAEADSAAAGFDAVERHAPDLVVTDLTLDGRSGLELTGQIRQHHPTLPVLVVSMHDEALFARRAVAAGARGYVGKRHAERLVVPALRALRAGQTFFDGHPGPAPGRDRPADPVATLSDREMEVFLLLGEGFAPRHIAERLSLSVSTVEAHRERMKDRLGIGSSPDLARFAIRWCKDRVE